MFRKLENLSYKSLFRVESTTTVKVLLGIDSIWRSSLKGSWPLVAMAAKANNSEGFMR